MSTILKTMFISGARDFYLLFWSIFFPIGLMIGLGTYFDDPSYRERIMIGVLAMSLIFGALNTTAIVILQQRNRGVYKLLRTTPMPTLLFVILITVARTLVSVLVSIVILFTGLFYFGIEASPASVLCILLVMAIGTLAFTALSFFIANLAQNEGQTNAISNLISLPLLFASEAFYPLDNAPVWVKWIRDLSPFNKIIEGMRDALLQEWSNVWFSLLFLLGFTLFSVFLAAVTFRWDTEISLWGKLARRRLK